MDIGQQIAADGGQSASRSQMIESRAIGRYLHFKCPDLMLAP
jgi:hypothetical protein